MAATIVTESHTLASSSHTVIRLPSEVVITVYADYTDWMIVYETIRKKVAGRQATRGPSWGHLLVVLGAILSFLEPFCGNLLPKVDKFSCKLTF